MAVGAEATVDGCVDATAAQDGVDIEYGGIVVRMVVVREELESWE